MSMSSSPTTTVTWPISAPRRSTTGQPGSIRNQETGTAIHRLIPGAAGPERTALLRPVAGLAKRALTAAALVAVLGAGSACGQSPATARSAGHVETIGHSARGRPIRAVRLGPADAPTKLLVVGV